MPEAPYNTYVLGKAAMYYDRDIVRMTTNDLGWLLRMPYRSIWRVLHIDGFEGWPPYRCRLTYSATKRRFFMYKEADGSPIS